MPEVFFVNSKYPASKSWCSLHVIKMEQIFVNLTKPLKFYTEPNGHSVVSISSFCFSFRNSIPPKAELNKLIKLTI